ncbi:TetR/AcrR family transcriptional regulator [Frankia sp. Cr1]|uniref:TetR/AcrR family transcriptional regulator n=1 Tax=Frankia sp. Cr1 TaxID=3073931 RepID=UPI002AD498D8|nr:TetR/AcrR family transcriptional regulator [Frankia sp. Cr1]
MTSITQRSRRTQAQRRDAARIAILETAIHLLADGGYGNMTLADLGERAGYSRSLATHYFGSKPKLLAAIIDHVLRESPPAALDDNVRGAERIEAEIIGLFDGLTANPSAARAYIVIAHEAATSLRELLPVIHQQNIAFRGRIESALSEGIELETIRAGLDPASVSIAVMAMIRGITWEWFTDTTLDLAACKQAILDQARVLCTATSG